jgi:pimeloyl-ACP methyl ester carboxylesterase
MTSANSVAIRAQQLDTHRHSTFYLEAGPTDGPVMIFVHGWPELSHTWRGQLPFFASLGFHVIAPDMRGYGTSATYAKHSDFRLEEVVQDMRELIQAMDTEKAIWVGHDWGCAVVWSIARHHPELCRGVVNLCVPFDTLENGWDGLLAHVDRRLYPEAAFPAGQWEYQKFYEESFEQATTTFDANPRNVIKALFQAGSPAGCGQIAATATTRQQGGWFAGQSPPDVPLDESVISQNDLEVYAHALTVKGFFGPDSYYMNHMANAAYTAQAREVELSLPVLFLHARFDFTCETMTSTLAEPMRRKCHHLTEGIIDSGHWMPQEQPEAVNKAIADWLPQVS